MKKEKTDENEQHSPKKARPSSHPKANKSSHDPLAIRTIVISGLPESIDSKALWKKVRKYEGAEKVEWPVVNKDDDEDSQDISTGTSSYPCRLPLLMCIYSARHFLNTFSSPRCNRQTSRTRFQRQPSLCYTQKTARQSRVSTFS